jgi:hypothetical protein
MSTGMKRTGSLGAIEHGQNYIIRRNESLHNLSRDSGNKSGEDSPSSVGSNPRDRAEDTPLLLRPANDKGQRFLQSNYYSSPGLLIPTPINTIRFQVVIWNIGKVDVVEGRVPVTFRVTLFWNDMPSIRSSRMSSTSLDDSTESAESGKTGNSVRWEMNGRQNATLKEVTNEADTVSVPPISILNVVTFDTIGAPEVDLLREDSGLWRWTCMYRATLIQEHWRVDEFPHDSHDICLKLAILAHRKPGQQWDKRFWKLDLATESDTQGSTRIPHGLVVDDMNIPEFSYNEKKGLEFDFLPLNHGPGGASYGNEDEKCLTVKLRVRRNSYYYDRNVVPLLGMLNLVAITITALGSDEFFERALLTLNIAFVEISIRMTTDKHLPSVAYQIKLQRLLNEYFFGLLFLVLESNLVYELQRMGYGRFNNWIDAFAGGSVFAHNAISLYHYYTSARILVEDKK